MTTDNPRFHRKSAIRRATLALALTLALPLALTGCGSVPFKGKHPKAASDMGSHQSLYDGKDDAAFATALPVTSAPEAIARGDMAMASGDLDKALFEYIRALEVDDGNADALYKIGLIHTMRGNAPLAEVAFRGALAKDPGNAGALTGLGVALLKRRAYDEARAHLERAVAIAPGIAKAHNALGVIADLNRDYKAAQGHYQRALDATPGSPSLLNNLGYSRYLGGNWDGAVSAFREALLADPSYERAWRNLALVYVRQERYTDAIESLSKVQEEAKAYNDVGYLAMLAGKLDKAQELFAEAKRLSPHFYAMADNNQRRVEIMQGHAAAP